MRKLEDRVAVVTGASSGIGRATAVALADRGCDLALADVNELGLAETRALLESSGRRISTHRVDVSDKKQMEDFTQAVLAEHGRVHVLVNNAGVGVASTFEQQSLEDFEWLFGINFWGVVYGCKFFLPHLRQADEAHIVNISSVFGIVGVPMNSSYCASKFAVRGLSESLRAELTGTHIGVTSVYPGGVATNIAKAARYGADPEAEDLRAQTVKLFTRMLPPAEAAAAIVRGIRRNSARVLITKEAHAIDAMKRIFPGLAGEALGRAWRYQADRRNRKGRSA
ncbi:MAG TPA: SDR family NAD(P)-dependent oxidoreductase [Polyangiaceae bacterium]|nr:SDR family NAD(P)-dependent oxidoreductase [Polyangiaceae bacterium]